MFAQYDPSTATPEKPRGVKQFYACGGVLSSAVTLMREKLDPKQPWDIQVRSTHATLHGTARWAAALQRGPARSAQIIASSSVTCPPRAWWVHGSCRRRRHATAAAAVLPDPTWLCPSCTDACHVPPEMDEMMGDDASQSNTSSAEGFNAVAVPPAGHAPPSSNAPPQCCTKLYCDSDAAGPDELTVEAFKALLAAGTVDGQSASQSLSPSLPSSLEWLAGSLAQLSDLALHATTWHADGTLVYSDEALFTAVFTDWTPWNACSYLFVAN
eukprot:COSAG01_NODE_902_length_12849_cov_26.940706_7_plen_270_part_00